MSDDWILPGMRFEPHKVIDAVHNPDSSFMLKFSKFLVGWDRCLNRTDLLMVVNSELFDPSSPYIMVGTLIDSHKIVRCLFEGVVYEEMTSWTFDAFHTSDWSMARYGGRRPEKWFSFKRLT